MISKEKWTQVKRRLPKPREDGSVVVEADTREFLNNLLMASEMMLTSLTWTEEKEERTPTRDEVEEITCKVTAIIQATRVLALGEEPELIDEFVGRTLN